MGEDIRKLDYGQHVVSGTPGRVSDMIKRGNLRTRAIRMLVLDEADEMLNKGFKEQIYDVYRYLPPDTQVGGRVNVDGCVSVGGWVCHSVCVCVIVWVGVSVCVCVCVYVRVCAPVCATLVQVVLVSATLPAEVLEMTAKFMTNPLRILVKR